MDELLEWLLYFQKWPAHNQKVSPVGGAHFDQRCSGLAHDVRDTERTSISTNSPLETITSLPAVRALSIRKTAEALLLTTIASSAPERFLNRFLRTESRDPRFPVSSSNSRLEYEHKRGRRFQRSLEVEHVRDWYEPPPLWH